ncbi:Ldh family oxidoreductase [Bacillus sp. EB01]|uniref:Ldh family oxidoreductase n=1 Tax=Bacillus sp. EB01 TaxID=1347086 RepID=UPI0005C4C132|nr:Ldh family oxidoreductase [Bacillus sp. EB01]
MSGKKISVNVLKPFGVALLSKCIPKDEAEIVMDTLIDADLSGVPSHGVSRITDYINRMESGLIERSTEIEFKSNTPTTALFNANNGWGQVVSVKAMNKAIEMAEQYGTGFVGVCGSNHNGTAAYFTKMAAEKGFVGIAMTNTSSTMVPFGGMEPSLGTNPISIAIPGPYGFPIVLDMATSNVARGKIIQAKKKNQKIPEGWAIKKDGEHTTDPEEALEGYMLPMGPKGSGLAIIIDILCGVMTGANFGKGVPRMYDDPEPQLIGHFFGAINVEGFMNRSAFDERMKEKVAETTGTKPMKGFDRVFMPGEIEYLKKKQQLEEGILLPQEIFEELIHTGKKYGVEMSDFVNMEKVQN